MEKNDAGIIIILAIGLLWTFAPTEFTPTECYQETATVATSCGGLSTGSYSSEGVFPSDTAPYYWDGDWSTAAATTACGAHLYASYSKPPLARNTSVWQVKYGERGGSTYQFTIPRACWNQNSLKFRNGNPCGGDLSCYDGSAWIPMAGMWTNFFYDEAMIWNMGG